MNFILKNIIFVSIFSGLICKLSGQKPVLFDRFDMFEKSMIRHNDTTYVVNFWATWCQPCIKELPYFESFAKTNIPNKIKVILVSLDFKSQIQSKLIPYIRKNKITTEMVVLTDNDYNSWLPKIDKNWGGSIPATLLISGGKQTFAEREFENDEELSDFVFSFIASLKK